MKQTICERIGEFKVSSFLRIYIFKYPLKKEIAIQINYNKLGRWKIKFFWAKY